MSTRIKQIPANNYRTIYISHLLAISQWPLWFRTMEAANWSMIATKYPINQSARFDLWPDHWVELPNWSWCRCSNKVAIHCTVPFPMAPRSSDLPGAIHDHYALYQRTRDLGDLTICDLRSAIYDLWKRERELGHADHGSEIHCIRARKYYG